jgi:hypothetical protein
MRRPVHAEHWAAFLEAFTEPDPEFEWMVEEARMKSERLRESESYRRPRCAGFPERV